MSSILYYRYYKPGASDVSLSLSLLDRVLKCYCVIYERVLYLYGCYYYEDGRDDDKECYREYALRLSYRQTRLV